MKRFISALSSFCLAATSIFSAFPAMSASAAGGSITITGDKVTANAGENVEFGFKVTNASEVAGMQLFFDFDGLQNVKMVDMPDNPAYMVEPTFNPSVGSFVWGGSTNEIAEEGGDLVVFTATVPSSAKSSYEVKLNSSEKNAVRNRTMEDVSLSFSPAVITVPNGSGSGSGDKIDGAMNITGDKAVAKCGDTVRVGFKVDTDPGTAGMQLFFNFDGLSAKMVSDPDPAAYLIEPTFNPSVGSFVWGGSTNEVADDGGYLVQFDVTIPSNAKSSYSISLNSSEKNAIRNREMQEVKYNFFPAVITVSDGSGSSDPEGMRLVGENVKTPAGTSVNVGLKVYDDPGTAGMQLFFDFGDLQNVTMVSDPDPAAYFIEPTFNPAAGSFVWGGSTDEVAEDGGYLVVFNVTVPANGSGDYEIKLNSKEKNAIRNREMQAVTYSYSPMIVSVGEELPPVTDTITLTGDTKTAKPGETVEVGVKISGDPGTAGMQMFFDFGKFTDVKLVDSDNPAYMIDMTNNMAEGFVGFGSATEEKAEDGSYLVMFSVKVPETAGTYKIDLSSAANDKTKIQNLNMQDIPYTYSPITVTVSDTPETTTTSTTKDDTPAGKSEWKIDTVKTGAGNAVSVPVTVSGDEGTSGFVVTFDADSALKFDSITWGNGYAGEATINGNKMTVVWSEADGNDAKAGSGAVMNLNFIAPDAVGVYPVSFESLEVVNTSGNALSVSKTNGAVIVDASIPSAGKSNWTIDTVNAEKGAKVAVPVTVSDDEGTAGFVVTFDYDDALKFDGFTWGDGYSGEATMNDKELTVVWGDDNGNNAQSGKGTVVTLNFTAPDAVGTYPVTFESLEVVDTNQQPLTVTKTNGAVVVSEGTPAGKSNWVIGTKEAEKSAKVAVPVTVSDDEGTSGFVVTFDYDDALTFDGFTWGEGYTGEATLNGKELTVVWAETDGNDAKAGDAPVLYLNFTAPDKNGEYPVTFASLEVVNTSGNPLTLKKTDGAVIVVDETTPNVPAGKATWTIGKEEVAKGAEVAVPVTVSNDDGTSGFVVTFDYDDALEFEGFTWGEGYEGEAIINGNELTVVWAEADGNDAKAGDEPILYLNFTAPETEGEYPVTFTALEVVNTSGNEVDVTKVDGAVIVREDVTDSTTTTSETTTTDSTDSSTTTTETTQSFFKQ